MNRFDRFMRIADMVILTLMGIGFAGAVLRMWELSQAQVYGAMLYVTFALADTIRRQPRGGNSGT